MADRPSRWTSTLGTLVGLVVLGVGTLALVVLIQLTAPEPEREGAVRRSAMLVEVGRPERGTFQPALPAMGTVRPVEDVVLRAQVAGRVQRVHEDFVPGRVVEAGEVLVEVEPADARNALIQANSALKAAEAALALERGRQEVARLERRQLTDTLTPEQEQLVVRAPQLAAAEASVEAARAAVSQARLTVSRTRVVAPYRALVLERSIHPGALLDPGTSLGRLVGTERFWVELTLPAARLRQLGEGGTPVVVRDGKRWEGEASRTGRVTSLLGHVDEQTRMARVLVEVDDPLALEPGTDGPPLLAGSFVQTELAGQALEDVVRIDGRWLRRAGGRDAVWVFDDGKLAVHEVEVIVQDDRFAYLASGLDPEALVVTTDLSTAREGSALRLEADAVPENRP